MIELVVIGSLLILAVVVIATTVENVQLKAEKKFNTILKYPYLDKDQ